MSFPGALGWPVRPSVATVTVPFYPLRPERAEIDRLRPAACLDSELIIRQLKNGVVARASDLAVVSALSPYSVLPHVMVVNLDAVYDPDPADWDRTLLGNAFDVAHCALCFLSQCCPEAHSLHAGFNWSPWSWGVNEERGGFQSLATKWHLMVWAWPDIRSSSPRSAARRRADRLPGKTGVEFVGLKDVSDYDRRLMGIEVPLEQARTLPSSCFVAPRMSRLFASTLLDRLQRSDTFPALEQLCDIGSAECDGRGLILPLLSKHCLFLDTWSQRAGIEEFLDVLFSPLVVELRSLMRDLFWCFCEESSQIAESLSSFFAAPKRTKGERELFLSKLRDFQWSLPTSDGVRKRLSEKQLPEGFVELYDSAIRRRGAGYSEGTRGANDDMREWMRRGLGYSLVFSADVEGRDCTLRVMPGFYCGPGGVVEAAGVLLKRPEFPAGKNEQNQRSVLMRALGNFVEGEILRRGELDFDMQGDEHSVWEEEVEFLRSCFPPEQLGVERLRDCGAVVEVVVLPKTAFDRRKQYVSVKLVLTAGPKYPRVAALTRTVEHRSLTEVQVERLQRELENKRREAAGTAMLWDLIQLTEDLLTHFNRPDGDCPICLLPFTDDVDHLKFTRCGHAIHTSCLADLVAEEAGTDAHLCPVCRGNIADDVEHLKCSELSRLSLDTAKSHRVAIDDTATGATVGIESSSLSRNLDALQKFHRQLFDLQQQQECMFSQLSRTLHGEGSARAEPDDTSAVEKAPEVDSSGLATPSQNVPRSESRSSRAGASSGKKKKKATTPLGSDEFNNGNLSSTASAARRRPAHGGRLHSYSKATERKPRRKGDRNDMP